MHCITYVYITFTTYTSLEKINKVINHIQPLLGFCLDSAFLKYNILFKTIVFNKKQKKSN